MSTLLQTNMVQPIVKLDEEGREIDLRSQFKKYLMLVFAEDQDGNEVRTFDIVVGRKEAIQMIAQVYTTDYETSLDIFQSTIISNSIKIEDGISFYSFVRMCLENNMLTQDEWDEALLDDTGEPFTIQDWDEFIIGNYGELIYETLPKVSEEDTYESRMHAFYVDDISKDEDKKE